MPAQQSLSLSCVGCQTLRTGEHYPNNGVEIEATESFICWNCWDNNVRSCDSCGRNFEMNGGDYNAEVLRAASVVNFIGYAITEDTDATICNECSYSCECGTRFEYEENSWECCEENSRLVHNYSYSPTFRFYEMTLGRNLVHKMYPRNGKLYMGFEIELAYATNSLVTFYDKANESYDSPRFMYVKDDASIGYNGAEFVTMPATMEAFEYAFPWDAFKAMHDEGVRGWAYNSCGMHIHLSRSAFMPSHLYKFMKFQTVNQDYCIAFSGRHSSFGQWDNDTMIDMNEKPSKYCKGYTPAERFSAINVTPRSTIELRYFKSNITRDGILRNAQWVDALYEYTKSMSITVPRANRWHWSRFITFLNNNNNTYPLLLPYLRRIECA